jgi:hypothetical protein
MSFTAGFTSFTYESQSFTDEAASFTGGTGSEKHRENDMAFGAAGFRLRPHDPKSRA